jgi:hypothetical protein
MIYPPLYLWVMAFALVIDGLLLSRFPRVDQFVERLPLWLCGLLVLVWSVGVWCLFTVSFGGLVLFIR